MKKAGLAVVAGATALAAVLAGSAWAADPIPYPNPGTPNTVTYTFTAANDGDVIVYFAGSTASYDEQVGMSVNGGPVGPLGLDNHSSSIGQTFDLGFANAGDTLTFYDYILTTGDVWSTDQSFNVDGYNHVYSTNYDDGSLDHSIPDGVYVAFEDINSNNLTSDFNYFDDTFVFENTKVVQSVPEPTSWSLMLLGFGVLGMALLARRRKTLA